VRPGPPQGQPSAARPRGRAGARLGAALLRDGAAAARTALTHPGERAALPQSLGRRALPTVALARDPAGGTSGGGPGRGLSSHAATVPRQPPPGARRGPP